MNDRFQSETALVLFSGGQDSATCLAWALDRFALVETIGFTDGQRHAVEMEARQTIRPALPRVRTGILLILPAGLLKMLRNV